MTKTNWKLPLLLAGVLALGMYLGTRMVKTTAENKGLFNFSFGSSDKLGKVLRSIESRYVDTVNFGSMEDVAINAMLENLDPHSSYVSAKEFKAMSESLDGNFEGIGIEFHLLNDTILVVNAISGGPSEELGVRAGDKIIKIDGKNVAGIHIKNSDVVGKLRGPSGTKVKVTVLRNGSGKTIDYTIIRDQIPLNSVDVSYMLNSETGYIKLTKFAATTEQEFLEAVGRLKEEGMKKLVLDLRGNGGGYLNAATALADHFLKDKDLIVYTQGRNQPRTDYYATNAGEFEDGALTVLVDEGSASASEIVAGAIQDLDRGTIIGRRTFGKGLVQDQMTFDDGSALRLTIARYFTPSGRCIQKSYANGSKAYDEELDERYKHGEFQSADSIRQDTVAYHTKAGRTVFGGGGVKPDVFVALDTTDFSIFYSMAAAMGMINDYAYAYADRNEKSLKTYKDFNDYNEHFQVSDAEYARFVAAVNAKQAIKDWKGVKRSEKLLKLQLKALISRQQWGEYGFFRVMQQRDNVLQQALKQ